MFLHKRGSAPPPGELPRQRVRGRSWRSRRVSQSPLRHASSLMREPRATSPERGRQKGNLYIVGCQMGKNGVYYQYI